MGSGLNFLKKKTDLDSEIWFNVYVMKINSIRVCFFAVMHATLAALTNSEAAKIVSVIMIMMCAFVLFCFENPSDPAPKKADKIIDI